MSLIRRTIAAAHACLFFQEPFQRRVVIEMIFDRIAFAGDDDDVFDAAGYALFHYVLICGLSTTLSISWLRFGCRKESCTKPRGWQNSFTNL
jgi:hypothetical protein